MSIGQVLQRKAEIDGILGAKIWGWWWAGYNGENLTLIPSGSHKLITRCKEGSGKVGRDLVNETGMLQAGYRVGLSIPDGTYGGPWNTSLPLLSIDRFADNINHYHNVYYLPDFSADGVFYVAFVFINSRQEGEREILGVDSQNFLRIDQKRKNLDICVGGTSLRIASGTVLPGPQVIEIARDAANLIRCRINDVPSGEVTLAGNWNLRGIGYDGVDSSQLDDYSGEFVFCKPNIPSSLQRSMCLARWYSRWGIK